MPLDPFGDELRNFESQCAVAQNLMLQGQHSGKMEASEAIIAHYNPAGLGGQEYFIYKGIKIFPTGKTSMIEDQENMSMERKLHGGTVIIEGRK